VLFARLAFRCVLGLRQFGRALVDKLLQVVAVLFKFLFGLLAGGDVAQKNEVFLTRLLAVGGADFDVPQGAVLASVLRLEAHAAFFDCVLDVFGDLRRCFQSVQVADVLLQQFLARIA